MTQAARFAAFSFADFVCLCRAQLAIFMTAHSVRAISICALMLVLASPATLLAQTDCLACHSDKTMQDAAGHSISVDGDKFGASIHGSLQCNNCHADIKEYPHPDHIAKVDCKTCHADEASKLPAACTHRRKNIPAPAVMEMLTRSFRKSDSRSAVYPLNIPKTCGQMP